MDRAIVPWLWVALLLLGHSGSAWAGPVLVVLTGMEADEPDAGERALRRLDSVDAARAVTLSQLQDEVRVVGLDRRAEDVGCGGPIWVEDWLARVDLVEAAVQLLDFNGALSLVAELELEVGCLDRVPERTDLQRLHLAAAGAADLASRTAGDTMQRFYADRLMLAARAARSLGDDLLLPPGLDPRIQRLVETVDLPQPVRVAAGGTDGRIFVDGLPIGRSGARLSPGLRLVQVLGGEGPAEVSAASLYPLSLPTVLFAGPLRRDQLAEDLVAVGQGLPATALVRTLGRLVTEEVVVADVSARGVTLHRLDGSVVRSTSGEASSSPSSTGPAAEREVVLAWYERFGFGGKDRPVVVGAGLSAVWTTLNDPVAGDLSGPAGGVGVWLRVPTPSWVTVAATVHPVAQREPLPPGYDADWLYRAQVPVRLGLRVEGRFDDRRWEAGADGLVVVLGDYGGTQRVVPGVALAGAVTRPVIDSRFALRVEAHGLVGRNLVGGGVVAGLDSTW